MMASDLGEMSALEQAGLVQRGEIDPIELVDAAIDRIDALDPLINAVVIRDFDAARDAALSVDRSLPFAGVPFLVKDLVASQAGVRQSEGSRFLREWIAPHDSHLVGRLRAAGLILLGRTNTPEFGNMATTEPVLYGICRNPWDLSLSPGGSSGGSAAAVAAGMVPMAHANDGGGSIRIPAACTGTFGLKPSRGRNPLGPDVRDLCGGLIAEHAITRSVRDSAALLDATCGAVGGEPSMLARPPESFLSVTETAPPPLRIGFQFGTVADGVHPECVRAVHDAAQLCAELGHQVVEASPIFDENYLDTFYEVWADSNSYMALRWERTLGRTAADDEFEPLTWSLVNAGRSRSAADHMLSLDRMQAIGRRFAAFFEAADVWATATVTRPPLPIGSFAGSPDAEQGGFASFTGGQFAPLVALANMSGNPAMSVPLHVTPSGLPVGVHFFGRFGDEATLFRLARQLEEARPWADRRPSLGGTSGRG